MAEPNLIQPEGIAQEIRDRLSYSLSIGTVTTTAAGTEATAEIVGTGPAQQLNLSLPSGPKGEDGSDGENGGIAEAPADGKTYGRKDADWVEVTGGGGGGTSLPYVPITNTYEYGYFTGTAYSMYTLGNRFMGQTEPYKLESLNFEKFGIGRLNVAISANGYLPIEFSAEGGHLALLNFNTYGISPNILGEPFPGAPVYPRFTFLILDSQLTGGAPGDKFVSIMAEGQGAQSLPYGFMIPSSAPKQIALEFGTDNVIYVHFPAGTMDGTIEVTDKVTLYDDTHSFGSLAVAAGAEDGIMNP